MKCNVCNTIGIIQFNFCIFITSVSILFTIVISIKSAMDVEGISKQDAVQVIREGLREFAHTERKKHRMETLNKNRVALGNIVTNSSFTTKFVVKMAVALKKKPLTVVEYKQLQNALIQSEEHVNSFLKVNNVLFALARDISGTDPILQLCATSCSCNIALGNAKACTSLTKSIGPYLVIELDTLNYPLLEVCIWTMGNLIAGSNKALEIIHAQGCFKYIVSLMQNCDNIIISSVAYTAMHYVHNGLNHIGHNDMIELTQAVAKRNPSFESTYFVWLIALLSSQVPCIPYLYNLVPSIIDYLYQIATNNFTAVTEITACIRILANTMQDQSGEMAKLLLQNQKHSRTDLETLLNRLLSCRCIHIRKETLWLIGNIYNHNSDGVKKLIEDIVPRLSSLKQAILSTTQETVSFNTGLAS